MDGLGGRGTDIAEVIRCQRFMRYYLINNVYLVHRDR